MAKEPPVLRFMLSYPINAQDLGPRVAQLAREGITDVRFEVIEDIKTFNKRPRVEHEVSAEELLLSFVNQHPTFKAIEAVRHFEANGRTKGSTYPALGVLVDKKVLKKLDENGHYARADIKHLAPPKKAKAKAKAIQHEITNAEFTLRYCKKNHGRFTTTKLREKFEGDGRQAASCNRAIAELLERRQIKRIGTGEYELADKPKINDVKTDVAPAAEA